ncbi:hypothetical protein ABW19_dt0204204 [Dactylella cylindrospora]|nr:hypothetical protein ABW19_dt0204204 [Dactylella cylindrospora]
MTILVDLLLPTGIYIVGSALSEYIGLTEWLEERTARAIEWCTGMPVPRRQRQRWRCRGQSDNQEDTEADKERLDDEMEKGITESQCGEAIGMVKAGGKTGGAEVEVKLEEVKMEETKDAKDSFEQVKLDDI